MQLRERGAFVFLTGQDEEWIHVALANLRRSVTNDSDSRRRRPSSSGANVGVQFVVNLFRTTESVRKATGVDFSLHDLRATCATGVRRVSGLPHVPALVLGHQGVPGVPDVTSRYDRADTVPEVAAGLNGWAAYIEGLLKGKDAAEVVSIRSKGQANLIRLRPRPPGALR